MGYQVNKRTKKNGTIYWRLIFREIKGNENCDKHIPVSQYVQHGFTPAMSHEEAKARAKQLNAQNRLHKQNQRAKVRALNRAATDRLLKSAHLPDRLVQEFESIYLRKRFAFGPNAESKLSKALSHWAYVKRMIVDLDIDARFWTDECRQFYQYFTQQETSLEYVSKLLHVLNLWGFFQARKLGHPFIPVSAPRGHDREIIRDGYDESDKTKKTSAPLTPEALGRAKSKIQEDLYNWLFVTVWFGLRPKEVDSLVSKGFKIDVDKASGIPVLWVYQSKLIGVPKDRRFKPIPCLFDEQLIGLDIIRSGRFRRPLVKTVRKHVSADVTLYGGRKGFTDLMLGRGQKLEDISTWLGHSTIERTWRSYKDKQSVRFTPVARVKAA